MTTLKTSLRLGILLGLFLALGTASAFAATAAEIESRSDQTLQKFYGHVVNGKEFVNKAKGVLIFPAVYKAGIGLGGEYGEGALRIDGKTVDYYSTAAGSIGLQLGFQKKSIILLFMDQVALDKFRASSGWKAGVDASVALVTVGAGGAIDTTQANKPILGFVFGQKGLMYNLSLEGAKFTKIHK